MANLNLDVTTRGESDSYTRLAGEAAVDYFAQLISRDKHRDFLKEADDARLRSLAGSNRRNGRTDPRHRPQHHSER